MNARINMGSRYTGTLGAMVDSARNRASKPLIDKARTNSASARGRINLKAVAEVLAERGLDPTVEIVKILRSGQLPPDIQARVLTTLLEYVHPKKKSVEITGAEGGPVQIENISDQVLVQIALRGTEDEPELVEDVTPNDDRTETTQPDHSG